VRRRILLAIMATVVLAVALAGTGTYLLVRRQAVKTAEEDLRREVESIAGLLELGRTTNAGDLQRNATAQTRIVRGLRLEGIAVQVRAANGVVRGDLPEGLSPRQVDASTREVGTTTSGRAGDLTWAATTVPGFRSSVVTVTITRTTDPPPPPIGWFLVGSAIALAVGAAVAARLASTLTRPLRHAQHATLQIAAGDLSTRLPEPPPGDHDEVADLTRAINHMAAQLAHSRGLERQFLLSVSHDLRTPLTSIRGYADAIADGTAPDAPDAARVIGSEAQRLTRLVGDLLDLARLDAHEFSFSLVSVPVAEVVEEAAEAFRPAAEDAGLSLTVRAAEVSTVGIVDPGRLGQCVANLLENALKFATTALWVDTHVAEDGTVSVHVTDDGPGIAPNDLPRVFERLYVTDRIPGRPVGGSGLGLAIVHQLTEGMGATVHAESPALPDGRGARFVITLPR
jgi:two-component system sensor histidine kinase BaeS